MHKEPTHAQGEARCGRHGPSGIQPQLEGMRKDLGQIEARCAHDWTAPVHDPIYEPGYHCEGDPPGTMGVDRQLPCDVPSRTVDRWTRTCRVCGKFEETTATEVAEVKFKPRF